MASSPAALWQQVLSAAGDEQLKTCYVEALVEEGDRQAEVLLVGAEIKRLFSKGDGCRADDLSAHYKTLLSAWRISFDAAAEKWQAKVGFHFGWPNELTLAASDFAQHAAEIVATLPVRHLNLTGVKDAPEIFALPQFSQIASLRASKQTWANKTLQALTASPQLRDLRWLDLSKTGLGDKQVETLAAASSLRGLAQLNLAENPCRNPVDISLSCGHDGSTGRIEVESLSLTEFGRELESRHGRIPWLNLLDLNRGRYPQDRYEF